MINNLSEKRKRFQDRVLNLMNDLDPTGENSNRWKNIFSNMSDKAFVDYVRSLKDEDHKSIHFELNATKPSTMPKLEDIERVANKNNIPLYARVILPHRASNDGEILVTKKVPILMVTVRRLQQILSKKNNTSSDISIRNPLTGAVTGDSKASSVNDTQICSLATKGMKYTAMEFLGPRSDDQVSKEQMLREIEEYGNVSMSNLDLKTENKQAIQTAEMFMIGAGIKISFEKRVDE